MSLIPTFSLSDSINYLSSFIYFYNAASDENTIKNTNNEIIEVSDFCDIDTDVTPMSRQQRFKKQALELLPELTPGETKILMLSFYKINKIMTVSRELNKSSFPSFNYILFKLCQHNSWNNYLNKLSIDIRPKQLIANERKWNIISTKL